MVDTNEPDGAARSFTHPDFDDIWAGFADSGTPFVNHVAVNGHYCAVPESFKNNGKSTIESGGDAPSGEPVEWIMDNSSPNMLVFASDYPHPEGTSDPIKKFEATMGNCDSDTMEAFYYGNMAELMGLR